MHHRTNKIVLFVVTSLFTISNYAFAENFLDLTIGADYRSRPLGGGTVAQAGFNQTLWGNNQDELFGYLRFGLEAEGTEGFVTSGGVAEIFPISIIGVQVGYRYTQSHIDYPDYDCSTYSCRGSFSESYYRIPLFLKAYGLSLTGSYQRSAWKSQEESSPRSHFIEPTSSLPILNRDAETGQHLRAAAFYDIYDSVKVGYFYGQWELNNHIASNLKERESHTWLALVRWATTNITGERSELSFTIGAGEMRTALNTIEPTAVAFLRFSPFAKMGF